MRSSKVAIIAAAAVLSLVTAGALAQLDCPVVSAGGNATSDGSILVVGQVIIGSVGPANRLHQGAVPCWAPCQLGDLNCDGVVDIVDYDILEFYLKGPDIFQQVGDLDDDDDCDMHDFSMLQTAANG